MAWVVEQGSAIVRQTEVRTSEKEANIANANQKDSIWKLNRRIEIVLCSGGEKFFRYKMPTQAVAQTLYLRTRLDIHWLPALDLASTALGPQSDFFELHHDFNTIISEYTRNVHTLTTCPS